MGLNFVVPSFFVHADEERDTAGLLRIGLRVPDHLLRLFPALQIVGKVDKTSHRTLLQCLPGLLPGRLHALLLRKLTLRAAVEDLWGDNKHLEDLLVQRHVLHEAIHFFLGAVRSYFPALCGHALTASGIKHHDSDKNERSKDTQCTQRAVLGHNAFSFGSLRYSRLIRRSR